MANSNNLNRTLNNPINKIKKNSRSPQGKSSKNGKACIIKFNNNNKISNLTEHICKFIDPKNITIEINDIVCLKLIYNEVNFKYKFN
jgi:hypothetical protein